MLQFSESGELNRTSHELKIQIPLVPGGLQGSSLICEERAGRPGRSAWLGF